MTDVTDTEPGVVAGGNLIEDLTTAEEILDFANRFCGEQGAGAEMEIIVTQPKGGSIKVRFECGSGKAGRNNDNDAGDDNEEREETAGSEE